LIINSFVVVDTESAREHVPVSSQPIPASHRKH